MTRWIPAIGSLLLAALCLAPRTSQADEKDSEAPAIKAAPVPPPPSAPPPSLETADAH